MAAACSRTLRRTEIQCTRRRTPRWRLDMARKNSEFTVLQDARIPAPRCYTMHEFRAHGATRVKIRPHGATCTAGCCYVPKCTAHGARRHCRLDLARYYEDKNSGLTVLQGHEFWAHGATRVKIRPHGATKVIPTYMSLLYLSTHSALLNIIFHQRVSISDTNGLCQNSRHHATTPPRHQATTKVGTHPPSLAYLLWEQDSDQFSR